MSASDKNEFQDPLEDYEPPVFEDPVEQALHDESVGSLRTTPLTAVPATMSVRDAMQLMVGTQIACLLVEENGKLVGVFSDRDVLDRVALEYDQVIDQPVRNVMSGNPVYVEESENAAKVLTVMAVSGYRHVPIVNAAGAPTGIVSPVRISQFLASSLKS